MYEIPQQTNAVYNSFLFTPFSRSNHQRQTYDAVGSFPHVYKWYDYTV